jgi:hypothetical protein
LGLAPQGHAVHERGEKHKEAVAKFLDDTQRRGVAAEKDEARRAQQLSELERVRRNSGGAICPPPHRTSAAYSQAV